MLLRDDLEGGGRWGEGGPRGRGYMYVCVCVCVCTVMSDSLQLHGL